MDTTMWMMTISDDDDDVKDILTVLRGKETKTGWGRPHSLQ